MEIQEHLEKRNPENGVWWPVQRKLKDNKWSKEIWHYNNRWNLAITHDMEITDYGKKLPFYKPSMSDNEKIYRVVHRNQLISIDDEIIHLPPIPTNKARMKEVFYKGVNAMSNYLISKGDLLDVKGREAYFDAIDSLWDDPNVGVFEFNDERYTAYEIALARVLYEGFDTLCQGLVPELEKIPSNYKGLIYVFNAYIGSRQKHFMDFKVANSIKTSPEILNLAANVRFFTTKKHLNNSINYVVSPSVFRGYDMYKRGINGGSPQKRLNEYVVMEYAPRYDKDCIEVADFEEHSSLLERIFNNINNDDYSENIYFPNGVGSDKKQLFLINALRIWSDVFAEIRVSSNYIRPTAIYKIDSNWGLDCERNDLDYPCPFCTEFYLGERFDCDDPGILGSLAAHGLLPIANIDKEYLEKMKR